MFSEFVTQESHTTQRRLTGREILPELMDEPCPYEELRDCLRDLAAVNRVTHAHRSTLNWLSQFASQTRADSPLHLVDVGCGGGDMLRQIELWAIQEGIALRLTGIDSNPDAIRAAREFTPSTSGIEWLVGRAESLDSTSAGVPIDLVINSLFTHHLSDEGVLAFLRWMEHTVQRGWLINDLYRTRVGQWGFAALAACARWHRFVRHDGPVSFRRAFVPSEWRLLCAEAGVPLETLRIETGWPARIHVSRVITSQVIAPQVIAPQVIAPQVSVSQVRQP